MEELSNDKSPRSGKVYRPEDFVEVRNAFTPLAYDVNMRIEVHNGDLYDRLLRILDRDELYVIIRDSLIHTLFPYTYLPTPLHSP